MRTVVVKNAILENLLEKSRKLTKQLREIDGEVYKIRNKCEHRFVPDKPYDPTDRWFSTSGYCEYCAKDGGWWCPKSPNGQCEYEQPDGHINPDHCIYCHLPDERK